MFDNQVTPVYWPIYHKSHIIMVIKKMIHNFAPPLSALSSVMTSVLQEDVIHHTKRTVHDPSMFIMSFRSVLFDNES